MSSFIQYLKNKYDNWGWVGQRAHDAVGIDKILGLDFIISCDYGKEVRDFFNNCLISLEEDKKKRLSWSNEDLNDEFEGKLEAPFLELMDKKDICLNAICYRSIVKLEKLSNILPQKLNLFAVPEKLKRKYDNKIYVRKKIQQLGITTIPGSTVKLDSTLYDKLKREFGIPFILQFPYGSSGKNTYKIRNKEEYEYIFGDNINQKVNALQYIEGYCLNVNAIITHQGKDKEVFCTVPSVQLTGLKECSHYPTIFCGNDYSVSKTLPKAVIGKVKFIVEKVGKWMASDGYKGIFGMDFIVDAKRKVFPIEINPRFQNSTSLFTSLEIMEEKEVPLFIFHIIEFLKLQDKYLKEFNYNISKNYFMSSPKGAQIILHNGPTEKVVQREILPGVYKYENEELNYIRSGTDLTNCKKKNEFLITSGVPFKDQLIAPFAPICKIQFRDSILNSDYKKLDPAVSNMVKSFYQHINIDYSNYSESGIF